MHLHKVITAETEGHVHELASYIQDLWPMFRKAMKSL